MTDIQAAVGREQLKRLTEIIPRRRILAARYHELLEDVPGIAPPEEPGWARSNWQSYCVRLPEGCDQQGVMQSMLDAGVATRRGIMCAHREPAYGLEPWSCGPDSANCNCQPGTCKNLIQSEQAQQQAVILPLFPQMTDADQDRVVAALHEACPG